MVFSICASSLSDNPVFPVWSRSKLNDWHKFRISSRQCDTCQSSGSIISLSMWHAISAISRSLVSAKVGGKENKGKRPPDCRLFLSLSCIPVISQRKLEGMWQNKRMAVSGWQCSPQYSSKRNLKKNSRPFTSFADFISISRLFRGLENCFTNFTNSRLCTLTLYDPCYPFVAMPVSSANHQPKPQILAT